MPTVPRYVQTERPRGYQNVTPTRGGEAVANAWNQAGRALQGAGNTMHDMAVDMTRRHNEAVAQEAMTAYEELRHTFWNGVIENRKGKNALGDQNSKDVITQAAEWQRDIVASLLEHKTEGQKRLLTDYFNKRGLNLQDQAQSWQQRQWDEYEAGEAQAFQQAQIKRAVDDPAQLTAAMGNYATSVLTFNRSRGVSDEATRLQVQQGWDKAGAGIVRQMIEAEDLAGAGRTLDMYEKDLSPALVRSLRADIKVRGEALTEKAERLAEKAARAQEAAKVEEETARVWGMVQHFEDPQKRSAEAVLLTKDLPVEQRTKVRAAIQANIDEDKLVRQAQLTDEYLTVGMIINNNPEDTPSQLAAKIQGAPLEDEVKQKALADIMATPAYKAEMQQKDDELLAQVKEAYDRGLTGNEYKAMVGRSGMSAKAVAEAMKYADNKGKYANVSQSDFAKQYKASAGVALKGAQLTRMYQIFAQQHPDGKAITKKELEDWCDGMALMGMDDTPLGTYLAEGRQAEFALNKEYLTDDVKRQAQQFYASKGLVKTSTSKAEQERLMLLFNTLSMGIPVGSFLSLEDLADASAADILNTAKNWNYED